MGDIEATRDLCVQLQKTKESLQRQISTQTMSYEQVQERLQDLESERDLVKQQVSLSLLYKHEGLLMNSLLSHAPIA